MPRDRLTWIVIPLAVIGLVLTIFWQQQEAAKTRAQAYANQPGTPAQPSANPTTTPLATTALPSPTPGQAETPEQNPSLKSDVATLEFSNARGGFAQVALSQNKAQDDHPVALNSDRAPVLGPVTRNRQASGAAGVYL